VEDNMHEGKGEGGLYVCMSLAGLGGGEGALGLKSSVGVYGKHALPASDLNIEVSWVLVLDVADHRPDQDRPLQGRER
jgi:hypothetical protein